MALLAGSNEGLQLYSATKSSLDLQATLSSRFDDFDVIVTQDDAIVLAYSVSQTEVAYLRCESTEALLHILLDQAGSASAEGTAVSPPAPTGSLGGQDPASSKPGLIFSTSFSIQGRLKALKLSPSGWLLQYSVSTVSTAAPNVYVHEITTGKTLLSIRASSSTFDAVVVSWPIAFDELERYLCHQAAGGLELYSIDSCPESNAEVVEREKSDDSPANATHVVRKLNHRLTIPMSVGDEEPSVLYFGFSPYCKHLLGRDLGASGSLGSENLHNDHQDVYLKPEHGSTCALVVCRPSNKRASGAIMAYNPDALTSGDGSRQPKPFLAAVVAQVDRFELSFGRLGGWALVKSTSEVDIHDSNHYYGSNSLHFLNLQAKQAVALTTGRDFTYAYGIQPVPIIPKSSDKYPEEKFVVVAGALPPTVSVYSVSASFPNAIPHYSDLRISCKLMATIGKLNVNFLAWEPNGRCVLLRGEGGMSGDTLIVRVDGPKCEVVARKQLISKTAFLFSPLGDCLVVGTTRPRFTVDNAIEVAGLGLDLSCARPYDELSKLTFLPLTRKELRSATLTPLPEAMTEAQANQSTVRKYVPPGMRGSGATGSAQSVDKCSVQIRDSGPTGLGITPAIAGFSQFSTPVPAKTAGMVSQTTQGGRRRRRDRK